MSKQTLTRPLTALVVGCIDDISKSVGKLFDNPRYADDRNNNPDTTGLDVIVVITKAVSHKLIEHWHAFGREHDILVINGDSKSTVIERMNEMVTILEPQRSEPRLNAVPISYDPKQPAAPAPKPEPVTTPAPSAGSSISAFMAEVQGLQKSKDEAEAHALKEMERADQLAAELKEVRQQIPREEDLQKRVDEAVEKRADGLAVQKTREIESELKQTRKTLEDKIKEVGRAEKRLEKAEEAKRRSQEVIDDLEDEIDQLKEVESKMTISARKLKLMMHMSHLTATMLASPDKLLNRFDKILRACEEDQEIASVMTEVAMNATGKAPKEAIGALLDAVTNSDGKNFAILDKSVMESEKAS
jgi:uncharacterized phage infection (PIP) family protein YhgE